ncbi:hypothetical protein [Actinophytocola sp.]|uniref:hypothetical protein n=1 Tax=Actinophytocola sp. TaxID=1872138 RepID=UPI003899B2A3
MRRLPVLATTLTLVVSACSAEGAGGGGDASGAKIAIVIAPVARRSRAAHGRA